MLTIQNDLNQFKTNLAELLLYCQVIEHDLKMIYGFLASTTNEEAVEIAKKVSFEHLTMGEMSHRIAQSGRFTAETERKLYYVTDRRNHWIHEGYLDFMYGHNDAIFAKRFEELETDHHYIKQLSSQLQAFRKKLYESRGNK